MKTPAQILNDYFFSFKDGHKEKIISAMKEYAKQWVEETVSRSIAILPDGYGWTQMESEIVRPVNKQIDAQ